VKNSILLPAILLFYTLIFLLFLTVISLFFLIISNHVDLQELTGRTVYYYFTSSMEGVLPGAVICALIFTFFYTLQHPGNRIISTLLMTATTAFLLGGGIIVLGLITPGEYTEQHTVSSLIKEKSFSSVNDIILYADEIEENTLINNLLADISREEKRQVLSSYPEAYGRHRDGKIEIAFLGDIRRRIVIDRDMQKARNFNFDFYTRELLSSYTLFTGELKNLASRGGLEFYLLCLGFSFLFVTTNMCMRISQWPLFNVIFLFFIITGIFFLYKLLNSVILMELDKVIQNSTVVTLIPVMGMFVLSIFFFLFDIIFIPHTLGDKES
jgi:hypothetical protein